jgi:hypothetical protein
MRVASDSEQTKAAVIQAAGELFANFGFSGVTARQVTNMRERLWEPSRREPRPSQSLRAFLPITVKLKLDAPPVRLSVQQNRAGTVSD